jgi:hypothetical protein
MADPVVDGRLNTDIIVDGNASDSLAHFVNHAAELMPKDDRDALASNTVSRVWLRYDVWSIEVFMQIGSANARECRLQTHPSRPNLRYWYIIDPDVLCGMESDCLHGSWHGFLEISLMLTL